MNVFNLNNHIEIPLFTKKERGVNFYAKLVWDQSDSLAFIQEPYPPGGSYFQPSGGPGLVTVTDGGYQSHAVGNQTCSPFQNQAVTTYFDSIIDQNNTVHPLPYGTSVQTGPGCGAGTYNVASNDGQWLLTVTYTNQNCSGNSCITSVTETDVSGNVYGGTAALSDPNGNQITETFSAPSTFTWTDPTGNTVFTSNANTASPPLVYSYPTQSGSMANVQVNYTSGFTFQNNFGCNLPYVYPGGGSLPTSISLPDGSSYSFVYESANGSYPSNTVTGRIHSITVPAGGTWTYAYSGGNNGINCTGTPGSPATITITGSDGSAWTYNRTPCTSNCTTGPWSQTVVTDPACNDTIYSFDANGDQMQAQTYQGTAGTAACPATSKTLLQTVTTCYNGDFTNCGTAPSTGACTNLGGPCRIDRYTYLPGLAQPSLSEIFYNSSELPTQDNEFDFGVNTGSAPTTTPLRATKTTYANIGSHILNRTSCVQVTGGTSPSTCGTVRGTTKSITKYLNYDSHGNVGQIQNWVSGSTYVSQNFTYYSTGLVNIATDVNGAQTTYTYGACNNSYLTVINEPLSLSKSMTWDCNGGVVTSGTDENSQVTSTTYNDPYFWRPQIFADQLGNQTHIYYGGPTLVTPWLKFNNNNSVTSVAHNSDGLGRPAFDQRYQSPTAQTYDTVSYAYDANGRLYSTTMPCSVGYGLNCPGGTPKTTQTYDALDRPLVTTDGGGGTVSYSYSGNDVLVTIGPAPSGEHAKQRQLEYDALGRLTSVCEITTLTGSGSCSQNTAASGYLTKYTYDALGNLLTVTQNAQPGGTQQARNYQYDAMSRLTSEANPESGTTSYTYDSDSTCGNYTGDMVKRIDTNGNVTCYKHDGLHRVTSITYPSGPNAAATPAKTFLYDSTSFSCPTGANVKGRLAEAYTGPSNAKITDLAYCYSPRGEMTDAYTASQSFSGYNHITKTYWANGQLQQLSGVPGLPTIYYGASDGSGLDGEGRITKILAASGPNPIACSTPPCVNYNVAGQVTNLIFGSGDSDSYTYDPNTGRMTQYQFNVNGQSAVSNLTWNANGTLASLNTTDPFNSYATQNCSYGYDDLARLANVNCPSAWAQTFTYDAFGNITKNGSLWWGPGYNPATNRYTLAGTQYDNNGNLLNDTFHTYQWDVDGHITALDVGGSNYTDYLTYDAFGNMAEYKQTYANGNPPWLAQLVYGVNGPAHVPLGQTTAGGTAFKLPLVGGAYMAAWSTTTVYGNSDWLGSIRLNSTPSRTVISDAVLAPFGEVYNSPTTWWYTFAGLTGFLTNNVWDADARRYHSSQGRWLSPDPAGLDAVDPSNPQSWDRYSYVSNNPLNRTDPAGLADDCGDQNPFKCTVTANTGYELVTTFSWKVLWQTVGDVSQKANDYLHAAYQAVVNSRTACVAAATAAGAYAAGYPLAETGAAGGAALGAFGGPFDEVTVPAGSALGGLALGGYGAVKGGQVGYALGQAACSTGTGNGGGSGSKKPKSGVSGKEGAKDIPSWAEGQRPKVGESGKDFAKRLCDEKYGEGNYPKGPGSEFSKIQKWGDRSFE